MMCLADKTDPADKTRRDNFIIAGYKFVGKDKQNCVKYTYPSG